MAKTAKERQQERRKRLKENQEEYEKYKQNDRNRKKRDNLAMTNKEKQVLRKRVRDAVRRFRDRQSSVNIPPAAPDHSTPVSQIYKSAASLSKAKRKAFKALPKSPSKRAAILRTLAAETLDAYFVPVPRHGLRLDAGTEDRIKKFYLSDDVSRVMPGKADYVTIRDNSGNKSREQKRHLYLTLAETYQAFKAENPDVQVGKSSFIALRPKWVLRSSQMPHNVCGCRYHSNIILILESLHRNFPDDFPLYSRDGFLSKCVCSLESEACMSDSCAECGDGRYFEANFSSKIEGSSEKRIAWFQWVQGKDKFIEKQESQGNVSEALLALKNMLPQFLWHSFIKTNQTKAYEEDKEYAKTPQSSTCLLQMDYAENFTCSWQDEIQSAHWRQRQVTLYTAMVYYQDQTRSYVIASDCGDHDKYTVAAFTSKLMEIIKVELPSFDAMHIWTDGPSSQFKNKYIFALLQTLQTKHDLDLTWNFFATSHGKGPNDALGRTVKRIAFRKVMSRQAIVNSAVSFADACRETGISASVVVMNKDDIDQQNTNLGVEPLWRDLKGFQGTMSTHWVKPGHNYISTKFYTLSHELKMREISYTRTAQCASPAEADASFSSEAVTPSADPNISSDLPAEPVGVFPTSSAVNRPVAKAQKSQVSKYVCPKCKWAYGHPKDPKLDDDWVRCRDCKVWHHLSCAENDGIIDDDDLFTCYSCLL